MGDVPAGDKMKVYLLEFVTMIEVKQKNKNAKPLRKSEISCTSFLRHIVSYRQLRCLKQHAFTISVDLKLGHRLAGFSTQSFRRLKSRCWLG